jgi:hypothetical protein
MITKNNWVACNLDERFTNPVSDYILTLTPYPFKPVDFNSAVEMTVKEIASNYGNLFLALSGGYDSEFVLRAFHKYGVPITPVIVLYGNEVESRYAYKVCDELRITPVEIKVTDEQFIEYYYEKIYKKFNVPGGFHATQSLFAAEYIEKNNGTLIIGGHVMSNGNTNIADEFSDTTEWDFYTHYLYPAVNAIDFYLYTAEIAYSVMPQHNTGTWSEHKHKLFNIEYREKIRPKYPRIVIDKLKEIIGDVTTYKHQNGYTWTREEFEQIFEKAILK